MANIKSKDIKTSFAQKLQDAVATWDEYVKPMRKCRQKMLAHYANGWFDGGSGSGYSAQPLNLIDRGIGIIAPLLVTKNPRAIISYRPGAGDRNLKVFARILEMALNHLFEEIDFAGLTLRPMVIDALFGMGIVKTGVMHSHKVEINGYLHDLGQPYADRIDFDDYIADVTARNYQEMILEGHWYRLPEEYVKTCGLFKHHGNLVPETSTYGDDTSPEIIAKPNLSNHYFELRPSVRLCDIWLPEENIIVTLPEKGNGGKIMRTVEWDGPEGGPFDRLAMKTFPQSVIPIPPVYTWLDLNKVINSMVNKYRSAVERERHIAVCSKGDTDDASELRTAVDGDWKALMNPESVKEVTIGGFNEKSFGFLEWALNQWSKSGPNMELTGGRASMSGTLGQEQMLQANAAREIDDMMHQVYETTKKIMRKLAWFLWSDPLIVLPMIKRIAGVDVKVEYSEYTKEGDFFDYGFDIEPYSMMRMNPEMRYQKLMQFVQGYILPTAQVAAQQGTILNVPELAKDFAQYLGITNLEDWYQSVMPQNTSMNPYQPQQGNVGQSGTNSPADNFNNALQKETASPMESSASPIGSTTGGM